MNTTTFRAPLVPAALPAARVALTERLLALAEER